MAAGTEAGAGASEADAAVVAPDAGGSVTTTVIGTSLEVAPATVVREDSPSGAVTGASLPGKLVSEFTDVVGLDSSELVHPTTTRSHSSESVQRSAGRRRVKAHRPRSRWELGADTFPAKQRFVG